MLVVLRDWRQEPSVRRNSALARSLGVLATTIAVGVGVLLLVPLLVELVFTARTPVAVVNGIEIRSSDYAQARDFRRFEIIRELNQLAVYREEDASASEEARGAIEDRINEARLGLSSADFQAVEDLINVELLRASAEADGVSASDDEVRAEKEKFLAVPPRPTPADAGVELQPDEPSAGFPSQPPTAPLDIRVNELLNRLGMSGELFEELMIARVLDRKFIADALATVAERQEHIHVRRIVAESQEEASAAVKRYNAGVSWPVLVREFSKAAADNAEGGESQENSEVDQGIANLELSESNEDDLGLVPRGILAAALEEAAFALELGSVSEPIGMPDGFHVLIVVDKESDRQLSEVHLKQLQDKAVAAFRQELRGSATVEYRLDSDKVQWAGRHGLKNVGELDAAVSSGAGAR